MVRVGEELQASNQLKKCLDANKIPAFDPETKQSLKTGLYSKTDLLLALVLGHSIRFRALIAPLADQVHRRGEKAVGWGSYPVMQKLIVSLLAAVGITGRAFPLVTRCDAVDRACGQLQQHQYGQPSSPRLQLRM